MADVYLCIRAGAWGMLYMSVYGPCKCKHIKLCNDLYVYFGQQHAPTTAAV